MRAGNSTVSPSENNSSLTSNTDCGVVDGRTSRLACCGLAGARYVTLQLTSPSNPANLKIGKLVVKVALPLCDPSQVLKETFNHFLRDPSSLLPLFVRLVVFLPMMHRTTTTLRQILVSP